MSNDAVWDLQKLKSLYESEGYKCSEVEGALSVTIPSEGDLEVVVVVGQNNVLMQNKVIPLDEVQDAQAMEGFFMRNNHFMSLSHVSVHRFADGEWFVVNGELSLISKPEVMLEELETLVANAIDVANALSEM